MLLFEKICSIAQILKLLHIPLETRRKLNAHKSLINVLFNAYVQRNGSMKIENNVIRKNQD